MRWLFIFVALASPVSIDARVRDYRHLESSAVRSITHAILIHAHEHDGVFPGSLRDLTGLDIPEALSIEMFVYFGAGKRSDEITADTPLVAFPWEDGIHIGYGGGTVRFHRAGHGDIPARLTRSVRNWKIAFIVLLLVQIFLIRALLSRKDSVNRKAEQIDDGNAEKPPGDERTS